jgi:hypothetical protein
VWSLERATWRMRHQATSQQHRFHPLADKHAATHACSRPSCLCPVYRTYELYARGGGVQSRAGGGAGFGNLNPKSLERVQGVGFGDWGSVCTHRVMQRQRLRSGSWATNSEPYGRHPDP